MATYMWLDSKNRDQLNYPNPSSFVITPNQTQDWPDEPRYVNMLVDSMGTRCDEFSVVSVIEMWVFYDGPVQPIVKLDIHNQLYNDSKLINTTDDNKNIKFILSFDRQFTSQMLYKSKQQQVMRIKRKGTFIVEVFDVDNNILDVGPLGRILILMEIKPYHLKYTSNDQTETLQKMDIIS